MSKEWFEQWFDSKYYHILYNYRDEGEAREFLDNLLDFLKIPLKSKIIDIGCGRGRHAKYLSEQGYDVTGIDIAAASIDFAKSFENNHLHFYCHDKRQTFRKETFDIALNLFTSYGFLKERSDLEKEKHGHESQDWRKNGLGLSQCGKNQALGVPKGKDQP